MKLERARDIYSDYEEGALSAPMKLALEQHFESDPEARRDYEEFSRLFGALSDSGTEEVDVPHGFRAKIMERATSEDLRRRAAHKPGFMESISAMFAPRGRQATGAVAALLVIVFFAAMHGKSGTGGNQYHGGFVDVQTPVTPVTVIQGVDTEPALDGTVYHDFRVHLPEGMGTAKVNAYAISATDQILDPAVRERDATPVLRPAQQLSDDESMKIPVALVRNGPAGSTLNILVEWQPDSPAKRGGAQVVFTPLNTADTVTPSTAPSSNGNFYDSLQTIASAYHVTVIADATQAPTTSVASWAPDDNAMTALNKVAGSASWGVRPLDSATYLVYKQ